MQRLYDRLSEYQNSDYYAFHMPGHKRNRNVVQEGLPAGIDITEIEGFDDLHHPGGILKEAQERAARVYHAEESCFLVNGSTAGILSAVLGSTKRGSRILMARNCHKSVYHAVFMNELQAEYVYPQYDSETGLNGAVDPDEIRRMLDENTGICAVVIVSPTYDGVLSDVGAIAEIAHAHGIPLIVDEAHGAHFGFHPYFPENANRKGADIVIHSLHKTLPSLTQTALLHMNGTIADREAVRMYLHMLQSSSPSYVLMASIDACICRLEEQGRAGFDPYVELLEQTRRELGRLQNIRLVPKPVGDRAQTAKYDRSKIVISVKGTELSGKELQRILRERYHLELEMSAGDYVLAMTSVGDTREGMNRLVSALQAIDTELGRSGGESEKRTAQTRSSDFRLPVLEQIWTSAEVRNRIQEGKTRTVVLSFGSSIGHISAEYAYLYPPGIPLVVPGERISGEAARLLERYETTGYEIEGTAHAGKIICCEE